MNAIRATVAFAIVAAFFGGIVFGGFAVAQSQRPAPVIGIVNIQAVMRDASSAKSIREQGEKLRASYTSEVSQRQQELRKIDEELTQQRAVLSPEAFQERQREFQEKVANVQREFQERKRQLDAAFGAAMKEVQKAFVKAVSQVAKDEGINLVLPKGQTVIADKSFDVTALVLERLDKALPSVEVAIPKE